MQFTVNTVYVAFLVASAGFVHATDNQPCQASCSHSAGDNVNMLVHTIDLVGTHELISDVTPAAGWNIQGCNPDWNSGSHTVQMTCEGTANQTQNCNHLFIGGAENTIVRLPESCGKGPFARVVSINETDGVHAMELDYNFKQIPYSESRGNVSFGITIGNGIPSKPTTAIQPRSTFSESIPFSFSKSIPFYNKTLNCSLGNDDSASLSLAINGSGAASGSVNIMGVLNGQLFPIPKVTDASLSAIMSGSASLSIDAEIDLKLSLATPEELVFTVGLPGLDIPGFAQIGPTFNVYTRAEIIVELQARAKLTAEWDISSIGVTWPTSAAPPTQNTTPKSSDPVHLSISGEVDELFGVEGHILPTFDFGVDLIDGTFEADASAQADIYLDLILELKEEASSSKRDHPRDLEKRADVSACVTLNAGLALTASVDGAIGPLVASDSIGPPPFILKLYDQCFQIAGNAPSRRRDFEAFEVMKRDLECPTSAAPLLQTLV